ncbi:hypothetical protein JCM12296A_39890 [Desulfosarcina cetonica]
MSRRAGIGYGQVTVTRDRFGGLHKVPIGDVDMGGGNDLGAQEADEKNRYGIKAVFHFLLDTLTGFVVMTWGV